ncbi:DUF481 domain-containing protein [Desulfatiglans anilini]|uniref:DUF481 domain-containing protein n=1 Tax=Desulfatiglans anilini TaxID=90728 RepID=UPI0004236493|nr:DUF481 domain-containing protein [Desulfatiglans anilini]
MLEASKKWIVLLAAGFWILSCEGASADQVRLKNGDQLSGRLISMEKGVLQLETSYAGTIQIDAKEIVCLTAEEKVTVLLQDDQVLIGKLTCPENETVEVEGEQVTTTQPMAITSLKAINPSPKIKSRGDITLGASRSTGNTDTLESNAAARFETRADRQRFTIAGKYNYGETDGVEDKRNALGTMKYDYFMTEKIYLYANTLLENDRFQDLKLRSTLGTGVGYQIFDTEKMALFVEAGPSYINKDFYEAEDESGAAGRWAVGFDWDILPNRVKFFHRHEGYIYDADGGAYYIRSEQGFRLPLLDRFFANFEVDYTYDSAPAPDRERSDTTYIFGLGYEFAL